MKNVENKKESDKTAKRLKRKVNSLDRIEDKPRENVPDMKPMLPRKRKQPPELKQLPVHPKKIREQHTSSRGRKELHHRQRQRFQTSTWPGTPSPTPVCRQVNREGLELPGTPVRTPATSKTNPWNRSYRPSVKKGPSGKITRDHHVPSNTQSQHISRLPSRIKL